MIALCAEHHRKADNGAFTNDQLLSYKKNKAHPGSVRGQFDWRRHTLLAVVGGNYYYETPRIFVLDGQDVVAVSRDDQGHLLLSARMLSLTNEERMVLVDNCWESIGCPIELISPPNGKRLSITYENGDHLSIIFSVVEDARGFEKRFGRAAFKPLQFPLTVVEINYRVGGTNIHLTPSGTTVGSSKFIGNVVAYCGTGLNVSLGFRWRQNMCLIPDPGSRLSSCPCGSGIRYKRCHGLLA